MIFLFKCLLENLTSQLGTHFPHVGPVTCDILWNVSGCIDFKIYTYIYCKITLKTQAKTYTVSQKIGRGQTRSSGVELESSWLLTRVVFIPQSAMSKSKELDFILILPLRLWYIKLEPECLCVCKIDEGLCSKRDSLRIYDIYAFISGRGGFLFVFSGVMFLFWHICAASACKHEPFWLYSSFLPVAAGGAACRDTTWWPLSQSWGNTVLLLLFWVLFWDLTIVYLFENKICELQFLTCLFFCIEMIRFACGLDNRCVRDELLAL